MKRIIAAITLILLMLIISALALSIIGLGGLLIIEHALNEAIEHLSEAITR